MRPALLPLLALLCVPAASALVALPMLPDLTVDQDRMNPTLTTIDYPATDCVVVEGMAPAGRHEVVRFATSLPNLGTADLVLGNPANEPGRFAWSDCHRHYHVIEYAAYRVWQPEDYLAYARARALAPEAPADQVLAALPPEAQPLSTHKHARCVIDLLMVLPVNPTYRSCNNQGITVGWADHYNANVVGQWVVIDGLAPGAYLVEIEVNAGRRYAELEYWNNSMVAPFTVE